MWWASPLLLMFPKHKEDIWVIGFHFRQFLTLLLVFIYTSSTGESSTKKSLNILKQYHFSLFHIWLQCLLKQNSSGKNVIDILLLNQRKDVSVKWRVLYYLLKSKLGVLYLTSQMTGKPVKHGNLLVNRWSGKSLQFSALADSQHLVGYPPAA